MLGERMREMEGGEGGQGGRELQGEGRGWGMECDSCALPEELFTNLRELLPHAPLKLREV